MKQILQSLKTGKVEVAEVPVPTLSSGTLLINTKNTLISSGTEKMLIEFGKAGWIEKARQQPDKLKMVLDKISSDGLMPTVDSIINKLDQPIPLGYCNVGVVCEVGSNVTKFNKGDRVISNGNHAEIINVPKNLCAKIPDTVSDEEATFTVLGAVALQGIRLIKPTLGENVVVTGLGLVGLITVQLLKANGCRVLGMDFDLEKLKLAKQFGADVVNLNEENPLAAADNFSRGRGVDAVIITATTKSNEPLHQAAKMCRKRGRIVLVGTSGLKLSRDDFFEKELTFQVSASYGPGRYDKNYEEKGQDYPIGFVRWTEQRNFEAILDLMAAKYLNVKPLISHTFDISDAKKAYDLITSSKSSLGVLLKYSEIKINTFQRNVNFENSKIKPLNYINQNENIKTSFLGSGRFATSVLIPAFKNAGAELKNVVSSKGVSGFYAGRKYGFSETTTDVNDLFEDENTDAIVISTRHNTHANYVLKALKAKKHIFVEKPLSLTLEELFQIQNSYSYEKHLMVGFNRRFAPQIKKIKSLLKGTNIPKALVMTINAGAILKDHWTQDKEIGGGRILGEACHFIDLLRFLVGRKIIDYKIQFMNSLSDDTATIQLKFEDNSIGTINYFSNGSKSFPKEKLEIFAGGGILELNNFRKLVGYDWPGFKKMNLWRQDKGHQNCVNAFVDAVSNNKPPPIPFEEILEVSKISINLVKN